MQYGEWDAGAATDDRVRCSWTLRGVAVDSDDEPADRVVREMVHLMNRFSCGTFARSSASHRCPF